MRRMPGTLDAEMQPFDSPASRGRQVSGGEKRTQTPSTGRARQGGGVGDDSFSVSSRSVNGTSVEPRVFGARFEQFTPARGSLESPGGTQPAEGSSPKDAAQASWPQLPPLTPASEERPKRPHARKTRLIKRASTTCRIAVKTLGMGIIAAALVGAVINWPPWVIDDEIKRSQIMSSLFCAGLFIVAVEDVLNINKSAVMLLVAATMWTFLAVGYHPTKSKAGARELHHELNKGLQDVGSVILFLLPAMGLVESIDHFGGFELVTVGIRKCMSGRRERLMPIVCVFVFFLSSVIDNLTATIVALKILRHVADGDREHRHICGGVAVIAANAGGAWSPVGDVTTTMLWIKAKVTTPVLVRKLFLPSLLTGLVPLAGLMWQSRRAAANDSDARRRGQPATRASNGAKADDDEAVGVKGAMSMKEQRRFEKLPLHDGDARSVAPERQVTRHQVIVLGAGVVFILMVPCLKITTGLPPYLGMLLALGAMWLLTDSMLSYLDEGENGEQHAESPDTVPATSPRDSECGCGHHGVMEALHKIDLSGLLFFTGVLLAVGALDSAGVLRRYAKSLVKLCGGSTVALCTLLGLSSAVVDNVPLVQASIDMFNEVTADDPLWHLVALAAGTGGSCLSIGSISGVTLMSMEGVGFLWYMRRIGPWALVGFFVGIGTYQLDHAIFG